MAIVHVAMKSSSTAPPAAAHANYISREGQYHKRGGVELVEHGNMPEFAQSDAHQFWQAADDYERANGRTYTELQIALPRELNEDTRKELAREVAREFMGDRFAYTMAIHIPLAHDNIEQPHMHLMFSERAIDERTRGLAEDQFFKRNGATKDRTWNDRDKPEELRGKWCEMMNRAMEREQIEVRVDPRSWAEQGREDLAALVEPKLLGGNGIEAQQMRQQVEELREQRAGLPALHLDQAQAAAKIEQEAERQIAGVREREAQELSRLDKMIAAVREMAHEVKDRAVTFAHDVKERVGQWMGHDRQESGAVSELDRARPPDAARAEQTGQQPQTASREEEAQKAPEAHAAALTPEQEARLMAYLDRKAEELDLKMDQEAATLKSLDAMVADFDKRMDKAEAEEIQKQQHERSHSRDRGHGFEMER